MSRGLRPTRPPAKTLLVAARKISREAPTNRSACARRECSDPRLNAVHDNGLVTGALSTRGSRPRYTEKFLVEYQTVPPTRKDPDDPRVSRIDTQQIWTLPQDRDTTRKQDVRKLTSTSRALVLDGIEKHLCSSAWSYSHESPWAVGRVVWIELVLPSAVNRSDQRALELFFKGVTGQDWPYAARRLPCLTIATSLPAQAAGEFPFPLITVVPLIYAPEFQKDFSDNPTITVKVPGITAVGRNIELSALTQLLLTVDYSSKARHVFQQDGALESWKVSFEEYAAVTTEVLKFLGLPR